MGEGLDAQKILDVMTAAMSQVGGRFQRNEIYVREMLTAARAMKEAMVVLVPVGMMWKGVNLAVVDLGTNVPPERFVEAAREKPDNVRAMARAVKKCGRYPISV